MGFLANEPLWVKQTLPVFWSVDVQFGLRTLQ